MVEVGTVPKVLAGFQEYIPQARLSCPTLIQGDKLSFTSNEYAMLCWRPWEIYLFLKRNRGEVDKEVWGQIGREEWGELQVEYKNKN